MIPIAVGHLLVSQPVGADCAHVPTASAASGLHGSTRRSMLTTMPDSRSRRTPSTGWHLRDRRDGRRPARERCGVCIRARPKSSSQSPSRDSVSVAWICITRRSALLLRHALWITCTPQGVASQSAPQSNPGTLQHALFAGIAFAVGCLTRLFRASRSWKCAFGVLERNERFVYKHLASYVIDINTDSSTDSARMSPRAGASIH